VGFRYTLCPREPSTIWNFDMVHIIYTVMISIIQ
jgi:hypothetical protein